MKRLLPILLISSILGGCASTNAENIEVAQIAPQTSQLEQDEARVKFANLRWFYLNTALKNESIAACVDFGEIENSRLMKLIDAYLMERANYVQTFDLTALDYVVSSLKSEASVLCSDVSEEAIADKPKSLFTKANVIITHQFKKDEK